MNDNREEFPVLIAQAGPLNGQRWPISESIVIGRDPSCEIAIPDRQVSRFHARLTRSAEGISLEDLASKNGSFCNGLRLVDEVILQDGDLVQIALAQHFVYLSSDATMPLEAGPITGEISTYRLNLDTRSRRVWIHRQEMVPPLSVPQFRLLQLLYEQPGRVVSRDEIVSAIWDSQDAEGVSEQAIDALVRRLRDRLVMLDASHNYIITVRGHGLRLDNPAE
jgi:DNA-binding response OmpR family regulator